MFPQVCPKQVMHLKCKKWPIPSPARLSLSYFFSLISSNLNCQERLILKLCSSRKYQYSPPPPPNIRFFFLYPQGNSSLASYFAPAKIVASKTPAPPSLEISNDLSWGGYGFFLEQESQCDSEQSSSRQCMILE